MRYLELLFCKYLGDDVIFFIVDSVFYFFFNCGIIFFLYLIIDFGLEKDFESVFVF